MFAFAGCSALTDVTIGNGVQTISERAFSDCSSLESITIGSSVKTIEQYAFSNCNSMISITIPGNVETIGIYCFQGCKSLESVIFNEGLKTISGGSFMGCPIKEVVIPNSVTTISTHYYRASGRDYFEGAFEDCTQLTSITLGKGITSIEQELFNNCTSLSTITFTGTVEQWNALSFGSNWRNGVPATKVICSDGEVTFN